MALRDPRPVLLVASLVGLSTSACAIEGTAGQDGVTDRSDDLVGRTVVVHPREPSVQLTGEAARLDISPEMRSSATTVEVWTDDVRLGLPAPRSLTFVTAERIDTLDKHLGITHFGLRLEGRSPADGDRWRRLDPVPGDETWNWYTIALGAQLDGTYRLAGVAVRYTDRDLGTQSLQQTRQISDIAMPIQPSELRFLLLPVWNFWEFDDSGYRAALVVD
jgi:hypothetical protein